MGKSEQISGGFSRLLSNKGTNVASVFSYYLSLQPDNTDYLWDHIFFSPANNSSQLLVTTK